ncbi:MAG TPA: DUF4190 domain-containing protein [Chloroflexota bacterium]|nr:DUF4190 domain-containing protein [Chloroflexota bacterium]HUM70257.1 DUF4190 domain-containing protein [Chloroflexota bacterium]
MKNEYPTYAPATHTLAIVSLVLSILGLAGILPLVGSIGGIISGRIARQEIVEKPEQYSGEGIARAGIVLGWLGIVMGLLFVCLILAAFLFFVPVRMTVG